MNMHLLPRSLGVILAATLCLAGAMPAALVAQKTQTSLTAQAQQLLTEQVSASAAVETLVQSSRSSRTGRIGDDAILTALAEVGYAKADVAEAGVAILRMDAGRTTEVLKRAGASAREVTEGLLRAGVREGAVLDALTGARFPARELLPVTVNDLRKDPAAAFDDLRARGLPVSELRGAVAETGVPLDMDCMGSDGLPMPCGDFGLGGNEPAMGQVSWEPQGQGEAGSVLVLESSNIPQVDVLLGGQQLEILVMTPSRVEARLPADPVTGELSLRRRSDGVQGVLENPYIVEPAAVPALDWIGFGAEAWAAAIDDANNWILGSEIRREYCSVQGPLAIGKPGVLGSSGFAGEIQARLEAMGAPSEIAAAWDRGFQAAWHGWADQVTIPSLPFYPPFALYPQAPGGITEAPPHVNIPARLSAFVSAGIGEMSPPVIRDRITAEIGPAAQGPAASEAIRAFADQLAARFGLYVAKTDVMAVYGAGPVPEFIEEQFIADVLTPVGPVVNGWCSGTGVLAASAF